MNWKLVFQVAATYVGAVMGAGFASGQEIQTFFANFGPKGVLGILISTVLFSLLGWIMLDLQSRWKVTSYLQFFKNLFGPSWGKRMDVLVSAMLFLGMIAMMSGAGALFVQYLDLSNWIGILLTAFVICLALWFRGEGVLWINSALIPFKFIFCIGIALLATVLLSTGEMGAFVLRQNPLIKNWPISGVLYVSFNLTLAMVVFASLVKIIPRNEARLGAVIGGIALGIFALVIAIALIRHPELAGFEIPMVALAGKLCQWSAFFYVVVLWSSMITAAIGNGYSLITRITSSINISYRKALAGILVIVIPMSTVKFSSIVNYVYPIFGYIGLIFFPLLLYHWRKI